jgi:Effector Associated Constant Component 1
MHTALLEISEEHADPLRMDELTRLLYRDMTDRGLRVERGAVSAPPGSKSGTAAVIGAVTVAAASSPVIVALVEGVFAWLTAGRIARVQRTIKITRGDASIELSDPSPEQKQQLIEWLIQHADPGEERS